MEWRQFASRPLCAKQAVVQGDKYRITVLTARLFRLEYSEDGVFEDRPTQCVLNRDFPVPQFRVFETDGSLKIVTEGVVLLYDKQKFSPSGLSLTVKSKGNAHNGVWHYGEEAGDLRGTARTLDNADGAVELEHGLLSDWGGYSLLDDSRSLLIRPDGWVEPRQGERTDLYFFGYGHAYQECLRDFYHLTGPAPLLPRYALGNWWSRFWPYTAEEYLALMERFDAEGTPFSVAVLDMDWHLTRVPEGYSGWTGYTWNRELIPEPDKLLARLHGMGLHVSLNLHPAEGVQPFEERYGEAAEFMGVTGGETIPFDLNDRRFRRAYFELLLHPLEDMGVDFWWIDWQQGTRSTVEGLDPLWLLNHWHFLDAARRGRRPLILSRYAGAGSHRYPVGFSGDTIASWASLDFQPRFTAAAADIGFGWWSHDIGGHMGDGLRDEELACRWLQFGVFSPICRLHSTCSPDAGKEPWRYSPEIAEIMRRFLALRHRLLPYLHSMNWRSHLEGIPLVRPLYHAWPDRPEAYEYPNVYEFGSQLIVAPVTAPGAGEKRAAEVRLWLPDGLWYDFFTDEVYEGGRRLTLRCPLERIPVFVRSGGIVPMQEPDCTEDLPERMTLHVWPGQGRFRLCEGEELCLEAAIYQNESGVYIKARSSPPGRKYIIIRHTSGKTTLKCEEGY